MSTCHIPTHPRDYKEHRTLGQVAQCLDNIKNLLLDKDEDTEDDRDTATDDDQVVCSNADMFESPIRARRSRNKENVLGDIKKSLNETSTSKAVVRKKRRNLNDISSDPDENLTNTAKNKQSNQKRLSLPESKPAVKKRVRANTVDNTGTKIVNNTSSNNVRKNNLEKKNKNGETPLHVACRRGQLDTVIKLLDDGANSNTQDYAGWTPLHEVVTAARLDIANKLLQVGV